MCLLTPTHLRMTLINRRRRRVEAVGAACMSVFEERGAAVVEIIGVLVFK